VCVYIYMYIPKYRDAGWVKEIKIIGSAGNATCQESLLACHFGAAHHRFYRSGIGDRTCGYYMQSDKTDILTSNKLSR
jgi:hypothetical protein